MHVTSAAWIDGLIIGGVDTHRDTHHAAVVDGVGRVLGSRQFTAVGAGYTQLLAWVQSFGQIERCGVWRAPAPTARA